MTPKRMADMSHAVNVLLLMRKIWTKVIYFDCFGSSVQHGRYRKYIARSLLVQCSSVLTGCSRCADRSSVIVLAVSQSKCFRQLTSFLLVAE